MMSIIPLHRQISIESSPSLGKKRSNPTLQQSTSLITADSNMNCISTATTMKSAPKKPMRPLTAYHLFFQIEREYIIQTSAGEVADPSILENKVHLADVPQRYRAIKLSLDWYAGPGKRQKRKHRKQHGKIGFLELSQAISTRWADLGTVDPETKAFVHKIAQKELDVYYKEMKEYKERCKQLGIPEEVPVPRKKTTTKMKRRNSVTKMSINKERTALTAAPELQQKKISESEMSSASYCNAASNFMPPALVQLQRDIDYFISRIDGSTEHLLPSSTYKMSELTPRTFNFQESNQYDVQYDNINQQAPKKKKAKTFHRQDSAISVSKFDTLIDIQGTKGQQAYVPRSVSGSSSDLSCSFGNGNVVAPSCSSPTAVEVDLCDDEILQLWRDHN